MDYQRSQVRAGVVRSGIAAAASSSTTRRVSASSSHTPSARSIDFASERSPLQKLELELKHISQGDINPAGVARSLSRRQPQPQHPLTPATSSNNNTTSASPTSPARKSYYNSVLGPVTPSPEPSLVSPAESLAPPTKSLPDRQASLRSPHDASSSRHRHRRYENPPSPMAQSMPRLFGWRGSPEDALSNSQTAPNTMQPDTAAPANSTMHQTMHHLFGGKEHHFEDTNAAAEPPKPESSKFFFKVAHLSLENRLPYYNDSDLGQHGRKDFHQVNEANQMPASSPSDPPLFKDSESDNPNFLRNTLRGFPGGFDGPADQEANPSKVQDGHHLHHVHDPENPSSHHHPDHLLVPHTKEEREEALIMAYLRAVPSRPVQDPKEFVPPISIKCGPLLRYTGLRRGDPSAVGIRTAAQEGKETWRGSIMIVTTDNSSRYAPPPTVRIFYVNPDGNDHDRDLREKAKIGKFKEVQAMNLHAEFGITFWRFNLEVEMADGESKIAYRINGGPPIYFWVPAKGQVMNMMFHSCNGFSLSVNPDDFSGPDPLWNDVLEKHKVKPFHVMLGGGDQGKRLVELHFFNCLRWHQSTTMLFRRIRPSFVIGFPSRRRS